MKASTPPTDLLPTLTLSVGVTGHRLHRLPDADLAVIAESMQMVLTRVRAALAKVHASQASAFAPQPPVARLVSALADGADSIASQAALIGAWRVEACLPFALAEYESDFAPGSARELFNMLSGAMAATFALNGSRAEANAAYEAAGRLVLEQSDVLLALWDGDRLRGRGGTAQVVSEAVARRIPVIHIDPAQPATIRILWAGLTEADPDHPTLDTVPAAKFEDVIEPVVSILTQPPEHPVDQQMLARFVAERSRARTPALPYPLLLAVSGVRRLSLNDLKPMQALDAKAELATLLAPVLDTGGYGDSLRAKLATRYGLADSAATYFAQIFRSGFVANFLLGALAVVLAMGGLLFPYLKVPLIVTELAVVILILANTHAGRRIGWHERWMDYRHLAEQLRANAMTSLLGHLNLRDEAGRDTLAIPGWVDWFARATARELGLPNVLADAAYLNRVKQCAEGYIDGQINYHRNNAKRMHALEHRLHRTGEVLFIATMFACVVWIVAKLTGAPMTWDGKIGATELVTVMTASLPALGAAIYGIRMQGDFAGVAFRSHETVARLEKLKRMLAADPLDYARLSARLKRLAEIMLTDVAHWRTTYEARPLALPG